MKRFIQAVPQYALVCIVALGMLVLQSKLNEADEHQGGANRHGSLSDTPCESTPNRGESLLVCSIEPPRNSTAYLSA